MKSNRHLKVGGVELHPCLGLFEMVKDVNQVVVMV